MIRQRRERLPYPPQEALVVTEQDEISKDSDAEQLVDYLQRYLPVKLEALGIGAKPEVQTWAISLVKKFEQESPSDFNQQELERFGLEISDPRDLTPREDDKQTGRKPEITASLEIGDKKSYKRPSLNLRERQVLQLIEIRKGFDSQARINELEKHAAWVFTQTKPEEDFESTVLPKLRGFAFEAFQHRMPRDSSELAAFAPISSMEAIEIEVQERGLIARERLVGRLEGARVKSIRGMRNESIVNYTRWGRYGVLYELAKQEIDRTKLIQEMGIPSRDILIYSPSRDPNRKTLDRELKANQKVVLKPNFKTKQWEVVGNKKLAAKYSEQLAELKKRADEQVKEISKDDITTPDGLLISPGGNIEGGIEVKCWENEEMEVVVKLLEEQTEQVEGQLHQEILTRRLGLDEKEKRKRLRRELRQLPMGGNFKAEDLNWYRDQFGKDKRNYPKLKGEEDTGLYLSLRIPQEKRYIATAAGMDWEQAQELITNLVFPANLSPDLLDRLQDQLELRGHKVIIQQTTTLSAHEVESMAVALVRNPDFVEALEEKHAGLVESEGKGRQIFRNLQARALALGMTSFESLAFEGDEVPKENLIHALKGQDAVPEEEVTQARRQILRLRNDYQEFEKTRKR